MSKRRHVLEGVAVLLAVAVILGAAAGLQRVREAVFPPPLQASSYELTIASGQMVQALTKGYNALAADVYWIRAIQHYGGVKLQLAGEAPRPGPSDYSLLYPFLDITTTLDPLFNIAYRFGSVFLAEPFPGGAGRPDLAIALLEKGLAARPEKWEYMQDIGFVHYWWRQDYGAAAHWFDKGSRVPGAPWWLRSLAAVTLAEGGDRRSSRLMWQAIYESAENQWLRGDAERRLAQLQALDDIDALQAIVGRVAQARGTVPTEWADIVQGGYLKEVPRDPSGAPYAIGPNGRVGLSPTSQLAPLPVEPRRAGPAVS
jgi:hypothetical protein